MVGTTSWFTQLRRLKHGSSHHNSNRMMAPTNQPESLGILAFDTAKSICRLVSLYKSLSDNEIHRLKTFIIPSEGIAFLTSQDENFLLTLACAERLEELDRSASVVARLGLKCTDLGLVRFDQVYQDLKTGHIDLDKLDRYGSKEIQNSINKIEKLTTLTAELHIELQSLVELETSEMKISHWKKINNLSITNHNLFDQKICNQRKLVRRLKESSLWCQTYDTIVSLMARIICVLYARIFVIVSPSNPIILPPSKNTHKYDKKVKYSIQNGTPDVNQRLSDARQTTMSGPLPRGTLRTPLVRFRSSNDSIFHTQDLETLLRVRLELRLKTYPQFSKHNNRSFQAAPPTTVGGSGLATRYANIILLAERYLNSNVVVGDQARQNLYNMLPSSMKMYIKTNLKVALQEAEDDEGGDDEIVEGWREMVDGILDWLVPMAQDTLTWQQERNMEKQRFDAKPTVLLLQTLHYADLNKTEAAISEVLVGLSCIYWYENRRASYMDMY